MVKKLSKYGKEYYQCPECLLVYKEQKLAEKCEKWCSKNKSCNLNIIKHSVNVGEINGKT